MTLRVHTARITYAGPDRLDVTRKSGDPAFAPSWSILGPMIRLRHDKGVAAERLAWPNYKVDYAAEMRISYRQNRPAWDALLSRPEVTLCCYCTDAAHCHRTVLAGFLGKLGATVCGERQPAPAKVLAVADYEQTAEEADAELRADGVDVEALLDNVAKAIRQV